MRLGYGYSKFSIDSRLAMVFGMPADGSLTPVRLLATNQRNTVHYTNAKVEGKYDLLGRKHDLVAGINLSYTHQDFPLSHISVGRVQVGRAIVRCTISPIGMPSVTRSARM